MRGATEELSTEEIERIAQRVAQLLRQPPVEPGPAAAASSPLVSAARLAQQLGVTRAWVYEHARELGAIQLGAGPRPRLRFDPRIAAQALASRNEQVAPTPPVERPHRARPRSVERAVPLLPLRGNATRGIRVPPITARRGGCI
jgi:hypothetical protein